MAKSRATFTFSSPNADGSKFFKEQGVNLGELAGTKHKGHRLFRESVGLLETAVFRIYGPKTCLVISESDYQDKSFTLKGVIAKPVHGKENTFEVLTPNVTIGFALPADEEV